MSGGHGSKWNTLKNVRAALRPLQDVQDEGQVRGWEPRRDDPRYPADPRPAPNRPAYEHYASDPGPHNGSLSWPNPPPLPQQSSPSLYQGQNQTGSNTHVYGASSPPGSHQTSHSQAYGQHQGYFSPPPANSHPQYPSGYPQQPMPSANQGYQGGQGTYPHSYNQTPYQAPVNSYSPPLPHRPDRQGAQGSSHTPTFPGPSYPAQYGGPSLSRTVTAPPNLHCEHRYPGDGFCDDCQRNYRYSSGR